MVNGIAPKPNLTFHKVKVGGAPVSFTRATSTSEAILHIAGERLSLAQWLEIRRSIDMLLRRELSPADWKALREQLAWLGKRDSLPQELRDYEGQGARPASTFLANNLDAIYAIPAGGRLIKAPWWLRWLYPWAVTRGNPVIG